jgi:hypothetical protein
MLLRVDPKKTIQKKGTYFIIVDVAGNIYGGILEVILTAVIVKIAYNYEIYI